jgi:hypothetical protein
MLGGGQIGQLLVEEVEVHTGRLGRLFSSG